MEEEIRQIIEDVSFTDYLNEDLSEKFKEKGYEFISDWDINEDMTLGSSKTTWDTQFKVSKDAITYSVYLDGEARAEISYERWVGSYSYIIDTISIQEIQEIKK